ncbi:MAG: TetR/AcrR family transcriptional regulator [Austwickia sp.]|nr:TetR/AcrR family transcriptional regulator [Austwickia sp.]MBK8437711.1 TetR/AcrR family transcriptional regulator [Austwickia sp.]MBK9100022.1 TetR/AcrR family transcriptional regulator [Austwickia sp.]
MHSTGYHAMSMQQLADRADVSVGLIYQYFGGKEDILRALIQDILEDFRDRVPMAVASAGPSPIARLTVGIRAFCEVIDAKRPGTLLAYREMKTLPLEDVERFKAVEHQTIEPIRQAILDGMESGVFRGVEVELVVHNVLMVAHGWALKHWHLASRMTLPDYVTAETDFILAALRPAMTEHAPPEHSPVTG